ncbi:carboxypeptidase-like regulatory domain-containing protein [Telluribacter sp. SYSU D00476]|uniref:carboxypeptidase-like regulatory domain-containing protein n=1 Tax=Telluribacter sp. SYSU D00476 TaxID=2811430 RepID=UPI001FF1C76B|nr:carboxypeptidase-like regulatory domain-containing protein [Telluribacter sp. SYSU D00476]
MKQQWIPWSGLLSFFILFFVLSNTTGCIRKLDRMTTIYGRVINEARQPVDSVLVVISPARFATVGAAIGKTYTDKDGNYELVVEVPTGYSFIDTSISYYSVERHRNKYQTEFLVYENGQQTNDCCSSAIGKKTNFDFLILSK